MTFKLLHHLRFAVLLLGLSSLVLAGCQDDESPAVEQPELPLATDFDSHVALEWNAMYVECEQYSDGYRPCPAARALGYIGLAVYEANVAGMPDYNSLASQYPGLEIPKAVGGQAYHWPTVTHFVYSKLMHSFFPHPKVSVGANMSALEQKHEADFKRQAGDEVYERSKDYGRAVADAVWNWSTTDAVGHDAYLDPFGTYDWQAAWTGPANWEPTFPGSGKGAFPGWGGARTFAITEADKLCKAPIPYSESKTSAFYAQGLEVFNAIDDTNWPEGQRIAFFWSDDFTGYTLSPVSRCISITNQVIQREDPSLEKAILTYAKMGLALNDASVAAWRSKYHYNLLRPETYIKRVIDSSWEPTLYNPLTSQIGVSPSFPAYPSGHSTFGGSCAEILTDLYGSRYAMVDRTHEGRTDFNGTPRSFNNFYEMAEENAYSRIPLGVHYRMDCEEGLKLGYRVGRKVNELDWKK